MKYFLYTPKITSESADKEYEELVNALRVIIGYKEVSTWHL